LELVYPCKMTEFGPTNENTNFCWCIYTINTQKIINSSFGVKGTANLMNLDVSKLNPNDAMIHLKQIMEPLLRLTLSRTYIPINHTSGFSTKYFTNSTLWRQSSFAVLESNGYLTKVYLISSNLKFKTCF
jgi:hypothetical protein